MTLLKGVGREADEIEIPLHEVQNEGLPSNLFILRGNIILPLGLNDTLSQILNAST